MSRSTVDASASTGIGGVSSASVNITIGSGANRYVRVKVCHWSQSAVSGLCTGVTFGGAAMTQAHDTGYSTANDRVITYEYKNPASGVNAVVASFNANTNSGRLQAKSYADVDQTTPSGTFASATGSGTAPSVTVTADATNDIVDDALCSDGTTATASMVADAGRTQRDNTVTGGEIGACSEDISPSASEVMDWTLSVSSTYAISGAAVKGIGAPAATLEQKSFIFRADDGSEASATNLNSENVNITRNSDFRLRNQIVATNDPTAKLFKYRYRKQGDDGWRDLNV